MYCPKFQDFLFARKNLKLEIEIFTIINLIVTKNLQVTFLCILISVIYLTYLQTMSSKFGAVSFH